MKSFEEYWDKYGELHATFCGGDIKQFAKEFWESAKESQVKDKYITYLEERIEALATKYPLGILDIASEASEERHNILRDNDDDYMLRNVLNDDDYLMLCKVLDDVNLLYCDILQSPNKLRDAAKDE